MHRNDGLVMEPKFLSPNRPPQRKLQVKPLNRALHHAVIEHRHLACAARFGLVQRGIGLAQHVVHRRIRRESNRTARTNGYVHQPLTDRDRRGNELHKSPRFSFNRDFGGCLIQHQNERIASRTVNVYAVAAQSGQPLAQCEKKFIAKGMAQRLINGLKIVNIE